MGDFAAFQKYMNQTGTRIGRNTETRRTSAPVRPWGYQNTIAAAAPNTSASSYIMKVQAEGPARRVRFHAHNTTFCAEHAPWKIAVAPTEKFARDTVANCWSRWEGGAVSDVLSSTAFPNGYKFATWDGAPMSPLVPASGQVNPAFGLPVAGTVTSDWIEVGALPATDYGNGDKYAYLFRFWSPADPTNNTVRQQISSAWYVNMLSNFDNFPSDYRLVVGVTANGLSLADITATPTLLPSTVGAGTSLPYITWEFDYGIETTSVWFVGDSITEAYRWPYMGVHRKSSAAKPWDVVNIGGSSTRSKDFLANMYVHMQAMGRPDFIFLPTMSPNNYSPISGFTKETAQFEIRRLLETVDQLQARGIKVVLWTSYFTGPDTDITSPIGAVNNAARILAASGKVTLMDVARDPRWNYDIYNASTKPLGMIDPDGTHPSGPNGIPFFATKVFETLSPF